MLLHELCDTVVNLIPEFVAGDGSQLLPRNFDTQVHRALVPYVDNHRVRSSAAGQEMRYGFNRLLGGGKADARWTHSGKSVQAFERKCKVCAPLVIGDSVNFVNDQGAHVAQNGAAALSCEQNVERLRRGHQDVRWALQHLLALVAERVTGAHGGANLRHQRSFFASQRGNLTQGAFQILLDIIAQSLQRGDVEYLGAVDKVAAQGFAHQTIDTDQESSQRLAGTRGGGDERSAPCEDMRPALLLLLCRRSEFSGEPLLSRRSRPGQGFGNGGEH